MSLTSVTAQMPSSLSSSGSAAFTVPLAGAAAPKGFKKFLVSCVRHWEHTWPVLPQDQQTNRVWARAEGRDVGKAARATFPLSCFSLHWSRYVHPSRWFWYSRSLIE